jgi:predicted aspartyl protease
MPAYETHGFQPPAPVAFIEVGSQQSGQVVSQVPMLLDTGADVTLLPRLPLEELLQSVPSTGQYELESFDGTKSSATAVKLEVEFLGKKFRGQFLLTEGSVGVIGRNILNLLRLTFDGPGLNWQENR